MPKKGENIYHRRDGRWEGRYIKGYVNGKIKYGYVYAKTYDEVKNKLSAFHITVHYNSTEILDKASVPEKDTFRVISSEWLDDNKNQWKESSVIKYTNMLNLYILPIFADSNISEITRDDIVKFSNHLMVNGGAAKKGLSPKTILCVISVIKNILLYASQIKGYDVADISRIPIRQAKKNLRILSLSEQQKLNDYLNSDITPCNLGILLSLYTGLRIGEICALKWQDISFDEQYLYVHKTMQRLQGNSEDTKTSIIITTPKSSCSIRKIPIPDEIFTLLKQYKKKEDAFLLTGLAHQYIEPRTMQNRLKNIAKICNISNVHFHTLRHTFATRCIELGFDVKSLSEILGHASVNITLNRYVHPSMELKQKNMNMLSELFTVR